ncbi:MAG: PAS domain-containing protein [Gammaproteobacteria bacterium]|nr:PAS domain-containing protein [Gammaproteobacteria bacterium]
MDARITRLSDGALVLSGPEITDRLRAEKALRLERDPLHEPVRAASRDALPITRTADGTAIDFNEAFTLLTGWSRYQGLGAPGTDLLRVADPEDLRRFRARLDRDGQVSDFETVLVTHDGRARGEHLAHLSRIDGSGCLVTVLHDISESRRTETALRESEEKFSRVFRSSPDAMCITRLSDLVLLDVNERFETLFGSEHRDLVGRPMSDFRAALSEDIIERHMALLGRTGDGARLRQSRNGPRHAPGAHSRPWSPLHACRHLRRALCDLADQGHARPAPGPGTAARERGPLPRRLRARRPSA